MGDRHNEAKSGSPGVIAVLAKHGLDYLASVAAAPLAPKRRFVLFGYGRVGSELLVSLLNSHPGIVCDGEIITDERLLFPEQFIEWRALKSMIHRPEAYGFKVLTGQVRNRRRLPDPKAMFARMAARGDVIVHMRRRNLLDVAVSFLQAEQIGWHHTATDAAASRPAPPMWADPVETIWGIHALEGADEWNRQLLSGIEHMTVTYEDDLERPSCRQATVDSITDRLGLARHQVHSDVVKVSPRSLQDRLANFDAVADVLSRTRYSRYLEVNQGGGR